MLICGKYDPFVFFVWFVEAESLYNPFMCQKQADNSLKQADCAINPLIPLQKAAHNVSHAEQPASKSEVARPKIRAERGDDFAGTTP